MAGPAQHPRQGLIELLSKLIHCLFLWLCRRGCFIGWAQCTHERFGTGHDAWDVCAADLNRNSMVYSFGVGEDMSFDIDLHRRFGLTIHAFDPTPSSMDWVRRQRLPEWIIPHAYGIAGLDGWAPFHPPEDLRHVSYTMLRPLAANAGTVQLPIKRLESIMTELGHAGLDVLKLDIEGAEYEVIADMARGAIRPHQLLVEFHHHLDGVGIGKTYTAMRTIARMGYRAVSISEAGYEFSFLRTPPPGSLSRLNGPVDDRPR